MEWFFENIFKFIYMPIFFIIGAMTMAIASYVFKDTGWYVPYRWLVIIGFVAYIAERIVQSK